MKQYYFIVNPASNSGKTRAQWLQVEKFFRQEGLAFDWTFTEHPHHATELAEKAAADGYPVVIAMGGDGTAHEVINGLYAHREKTGICPAFTLLSGGTGCDLIRTLKIPDEPREFLRYLRAAEPTEIDLIEHKYTRMDGTDHRCMLLNVGDVGLGAAIVNAVNQANREGGRGPKVLSYFKKILSGIANPERLEIELYTDGQLLYRGGSRLAVFANGIFFGGGIKISPKSALTDGKFEVLTCTDLSRFELYCVVPRIYLGTHERHPKVMSVQAEHARVTLKHPTIMESDGEVLGKVIAAEMTICKSALPMLF